MERSKGIVQRRPILAIAAVLAIAAGIVYGVTGCHNNSGKAVAHAATLSLNPQPIQYPGFPVPGAVIEGWIASNNTAAMRQHAWDLWKGINAITPQTQGAPVWETWYSGPEIGDQGAGTCAVSNAEMLGATRATGKPMHDFQVPEQFHHNRFMRRSLAAGEGAVTVPLEVTVKFNSDYAHFVLDNHYCDRNTLWKLQESWGTQPLVNRHTKAFPTTAIGLKPTFEFVNGPNHNNGITVVNYWKGDLSSGPANSTNKAFPTPDTWTQCVVVNTGSGPVPSGLQCAVSNAPKPIQPTGTVSLDQFYHFQLSAAEATQVCNNLGTKDNCAVQAGDYAILTAMHMSTKEDSNWTWQTFWWNYGSDFPYGAPPADIPAPFNHYAMSEGYSMTVQNKPAGPNELAYNPYLETGLGPYTHGVNSNCLSCHMVASLGNNPNSNAQTPPPNSPNSGSGYPAYYPGQIYNYPVTNRVAQLAFYDCMTTTDTSWFVQGFAGSGPSGQPPCVLTSMKKSSKH